MAQATDKTIRIAMWSGPRNISTAMMRSFGNRPAIIEAKRSVLASHGELRCTVAECRTSRTHRNIEHENFLP